MRSAAVAVLANAIVVTQVAGQTLAGLRAAAGLPTNPVPPAADPAPTTPPLTQGQQSARIRQLQNASRITNAQDLAHQAQAAARAAAEMQTPTVPNGLVIGGLQQVANPVPAAQDPTGLHTWQGADNPTQTQANGHTDVTIHQTQSRAVLSWETFNVGRDTTVNFQQQVDGKPQKDWVALNRVVGGLNPATGRRDATTAPAPSQILGSIKADGTVLVLNQNGVLFSATSQVNTHSFAATSLEIGRAISGSTALTIGQRNDEFLAFGLLGFADQASSTDKPTAFTFSGQQIDSTHADPLLEGTIQVQAGATITANDGGFVLLAAPKVENGGALSAALGQVSLQSGRQITLRRSEGKPDSLDPDVRGFVIDVVSRSDFTDDYVLNDASGTIDAAQGYISLGASTNGAVINRGVLHSTTSVSRNGFIRLTGGDIQLAPDSAIAIVADTGDQTIPQDPISLAAFKNSRISIGSASSRIEMGTGSTIFAPNADVDIGSAPGQTTIADPSTLHSRVFIDSGAVIDVSGMGDVLIPATRNSILISPVKRNELRDSPTYRDDFLNGAKVYVDPRKSGVREDGVAWIGSPLIEAGSFYQQVSVTAAELMTKGGNVTLGVASFAGMDPALAPDVIVKQGAEIDMAGGWVRYEAGIVQETRLIDASGRIVDISAADPNDTFIGQVTGYVRMQPRWGITESWTSPLLIGSHAVGEYTEGRDAGSLTVKGSVAVLDGTVHADAFAGPKQLADAAQGTATSGIYGDHRALQGAPSQMPSGGFLFVQALGKDQSGNTTGGADIAIVDSAQYQPLASDFAYGQSLSVDANGQLVRPARDPASFLPAERRDTITLADDSINAMGLSQLSLVTSGKVTVAAGSETHINPGGSFDALAGRALTVDGAVYVPGGAINLETASLLGGGSVLTPDEQHLGSFDVTVNGTLSVRGQWVNDYGEQDGGFQGGAFTDGGSITIVAAPRVTQSAEIATVGETQNGTAPETNIDISGSILINDGATVDVSGGGQVRQDGSLDLTAHGGNLSLYAETNYFQLVEDANKAAGGIEGFRVSTLIRAGDNAHVVPVNPDHINARVAIADCSVLAAGFAGGGTFSLSTPEFQFGDTVASTGTNLPMNFFSTAGFANYNITSYKTALIANTFNNGFGGFNAVLATQTLTVGDGETLNLSQAMFNPVPTIGETGALRALATGGDLYSVLTPSAPSAQWDRRAVNLTLGGLIELHVAAGGRIEGEAGTQLTVSKLFNEGTIRLPGGTITQSEILPSIYTGSQALAVHDLGEAFTIDPDGTIRENAANAQGIRRDGGGPVLKNAELADQYSIYLLGDLEANEGVRLAAGSVLDLSGTSIVNPRAVANGIGSPTSIHDGRMVAGGTLALLPGQLESASIFHGSSGTSDYSTHNPTAVRVSDQINAQAGSTIDISGASDTFDKLDVDGHYAPTPQWSNAGTLFLGNGGFLTGANIDAHGGADKALGGTLIALDPVLYQEDPLTPTLDAISANAIAASGFDTMEALGSVTSFGDVTLDLGRGFFLATRPFGNLPGQDLSSPAVRDSLAPVVRSGGNFVINASYVRLESNFQTLSSPNYGTPGANSITFNADTIDVVGAVLFDRSIANAQLNATHDVRLTGVQPYQHTYNVVGSDVPNSLAGQLAVNGNLTITAGQVYPTTGSTFLITSTAAAGTIAFARSAGPLPDGPYSAGGNLTVQAANIVQGGVIRVPLGHLTLGGTTALTITNGSVTNTFAPVTASVEATDGSVTSVSAEGRIIPYGTTTDQIEWFFEPTGANALDAPPAAVLSFAGTDVTLDHGATVDVRGGGDLYAYEFISGTGGSRDELDRFNADPFSGNNGFQYPGGKQVFAIVPGLSDAAVAAYDPIYSADYGDLSGVANAGMRVYLSAAPGLAAGWYTLLPAKYALLPGGMRVVMRSDNAGLKPDSHATLLDGTIVTTGYLGTTGGDSQGSQLLAFDIQSQKVFRSYTNIAQTFANETFAARAKRNGLVPPRLPIDAGRLVLNPAATLAVNTTIQSEPGTGGRGAEADISGQSIEVVSDLSGGPPAPGTIVLTADSLTNLNASSLLLGGVRTENADGTTTLDITATSIEVANDAAHPLTAPEVLLAVDGANSSIAIDDGAAIVANGASTAGGDYIIDGSRGAMTGQGALVRVASGPERLVTRKNQDAVAPGALTVGAATLNGKSVLLDSSGDMSVDPLADIEASSLALDAGKVTFTGDPTGLSGLVITPTLQALFGHADQLTIRTSSTIDFSAGQYAFGNLRLDTPGLLLLDGSEVDITAANLSLGNSSAAGVACAPACGSGILNVSAHEIAFGSGTVRTFGFGGAVSLAGSKGMFVEGKATFDAGTASLTLDTPFLGDRAVGLTIGATALIPSLSINTTAAIAVRNTSGAAAPTADGVPGAQLALNGNSIDVRGARLRATAGTLALTSQTGITVADGAYLETPGYARRFGDDADHTDVSAPGGRLAMTTLDGDINVASGTTLSVGGGKGRAGTLDLSAPNGGVTLDGTIDAAAPDGGGSLVLDSGVAFNLSAFAAGAAHAFDGLIDIRTRTGDLALDAGDTLRAEDVRLTADAGAVDIAGTIDVSGANGGDVGLYGHDGVTLRSTASIDAHANGYAATDTRIAQAGNVELGTVGTGAIAVESGATIDVSAHHTQDRLVPQLRNGTLYYTYVQGDRGGTVNLRAPVIEQPGADTVNVSFAGTIIGARSIVLEGFKTFDLAAIAADPNFVGVTINGSGQAELDLAAIAPGKLNFLADDGAGTLVSFVQDFDVSGAYANLGGLASSAVFHARAGMDLEYSGDIVLVSNWNLGAGVVDVTRAVNDGLMAPDPSAPGKFYVIPGKEAELLAGYTRMVYRTDTDHDGFGNVDGEPGVLTLRAGGTLDIQGSISDGFFQFRDQTDPDYLNVALGGGDQVYTASLNTRCQGDCNAVTAWTTGVLPTNFVSLNIPGASGLGGILQNPAPYSAAANSPAALGSLPGNTGDPIGSAELFPLIDTGNGLHAVESSSLRMVGGAAASADPLQTQAGSPGNVVVEGDHDYTYAGVKGTQQFNDTFLLRVGTSNVSADDWMAAFLAANANAGIDANSYTFVNFQTAPAAFKTFLSDQAKTYFASHPGEFQFNGPPGAPTGVTTTLAFAAAFMRDVVAPNFAAFNDQYSPAAPALVKAPTTATTRTLVRTGTGDIAVAAAANIDLRDGLTATYRKADGTITTSDKGLQSGGTSIYTAGHVADLTPRLAFDPVSNSMVMVDPGAFADPSNIFVNPPTYRYGAGGSPTGLGTGFLGILLANPQYAEGGGDVSLDAGGDVLGRREIWRQDEIDSSNAVTATSGDTWIGTGDQPWRSGNVDGSPDIRINPQLFGDGVATLGGGNVRVTAGGNVSDLTVVADTSVSTASVATGGTAPTLALTTFGGGNVDIAAQNDILGGRLDMGSGAARVSAGGSIGSAGLVRIAFNQVAGDNLLRLRLADAAIAVDAGQSIVIQGIAALGVHKPQNDANVEANMDAFGFYSAGAGVSMLSDGTVTATNHTNTDVIKNPDLLLPSIAATRFTVSAVYPGTFEAASLAGTVDLRTGGSQTANAILLYPSPSGNLELFAAGTIGPVTIGMDDSDPGILPGAFSTYRADAANGTLGGRTFIFPGVLPNATDVQLAQLHNPGITHADDLVPVRIYSGGDINGMILAVPKQARVGAARDIVNMMFFGQNVHTDDVTRIVAGRDITATTKLVRPVIDANRTLGAPQAALQGNTFVIGGPGAFFLEAGRDAGPFLNSAVTDGFRILSGFIGETGTLTYGGGVLSIGNSWNRALPDGGADVYVLFGVGPGATFDAFRDYYVDPANVANLDGDLFEQIKDSNGGLTPDRSKPIYASILISWMKAHATAQLEATYGTTDVTYQQAFDLFKTLPELTQRVFLVSQVYFNELSAPSIPDGPSFKQYSRGYLAVNTLFPSSLGYTQNDLTGGSNGANETVETGNLDLRLATIQTQRGGDVFILGPGGRVLAGSTVRTSVQAARRTFDGGNLFTGVAGNDRNAIFPAVIQSIPLGYEGILTLRGGAIHSFTDRDFLLNQSRLFTEGGGDVVMWSSNGDLNAGQGPKTSANFPPVIVRIDENGFAEVDAVGGVSGAGIGAFQPAPGEPAPSVFLIAPRGTVDAGDAGVRVAGSLFVAALTVANSENFSVGGSSFGIPTSAVVDVGAASSANAASSAAQQAASAVAGTRAGGEAPSVITVEVLGYYGEDCPPGSTDPRCATRH